MEKVCNGQDTESPVVHEVAGEPAIVINGVPDLIPGGISPIHQDTLYDSDSSDDPCFGEWLEGRMVRKLFGDQYYSGKVVKYNMETQWYRVIYEDGDVEDLEWHELEEMLLPLDISIPLTTLALQRCKPEKSVYVSGINVAKARKNHMKSLVSAEKTLELPQLPQMSESKNGKPVEVNFNSERTWQETLPMQKGIPVENIETPVELCSYGVSMSKQGEDANASVYCHHEKSLAKPLEIFQRPETYNIKGDGQVQINVHREAAAQESIKGRREFQKQSWRTARAEKQKRRAKSLVQ